DELKGIKLEQHEMKSEMTSFKQEQLEMKNDVYGIKQEVNKMKQTQNKMQHDLQTTSDRLISMESQQKAILEQTAKSLEYHSEVLAKLEHVLTKDDDLEYFDKKIGEHEREIFKLK